jgi:hypothetical protein
MAGRPRKENPPVAVLRCHWQNQGTGERCTKEVTGIVAYCEDHEGCIPTGAPGPGGGASLSRHGMHHWT